MEKKNIFKVFKEGIIVFIVMIVLCMGICATYAYNFNKDRGYYEFAYKYNTDIVVDLNDIVSEENITKVQGITTSYYTGGSVGSYGYVTITEKQISIKKVNDYIVINLNLDCLKDLPDNFKKETVVKGFLKHLAITSFDETLYEDVINESGKTIKGVSYVFDASSLSLNEKVEHVKRNMVILWSLIGLGIGIVVGMTLVLLLGYKFPNKKGKEDIYDNDTIFRTPFHKEYWKKTVNEMKKLKKVTLMSILLAMTLAYKFIPIPSGFGNLGLGWGLFFLGTCGMLFGPVPCLIIGALSDILGFFINSGGGAFFPLYTVQAMLACFIYGIFFYRTRLNYTRVLFARLLVNIFVNAIFGSICWAIISNFNFQQTMDYIFIISLPKNIAYLIPQSIMLYGVLRVAAVIAESTYYIEPKIAENITIF